MVDLDELIRLLHDPAGAFLRQRLQVAVPGDEALPSDSLPIEVDGLQKWAIGDALLRRRLAGVDLETCRQLEWRRGRVPPGRLGGAVLDEICALVEDLVAAAAEARAAAPAHTIDLVVPLTDGRQLARHDRPGSRHTVGPGGLLPTATARSAGRLGAAARADGRGARTGIGPRSPSVAPGGPVSARRPSSAPEQDAAITVLDQLVGLYDNGLRAPLPIPERTACSYAEHRHAGAPVDRAWEAAETRMVGPQQLSR